MSPALSRLAVLLALAASPALAVGSDDDEAPPKPSETTTLCEDGLVWDAEQALCVPIAETTEDEAALRLMVRELAYAGRYADAGAVLDLLPEVDGFVLTYRGFIARQSGDWLAAEGFYRAAIAADPGNALARAYYGMGLVERGAYASARLHLAAIRDAGGAGTWPERALAEAIRTGTTTSY